MPGNTPQINNQQEITRATHNWGNTPALSVIDIPGPAVIKIPGVLPEKLKQMRIEASTGEDHTVRDLMAVLGAQGIPSIITSDEVADTYVPITNYKGTIGGLLSAVSKSLNVSFSWEDGVLIVGRQGGYVFAIVQNEEVGGKIKEDLASMGAEGVEFSLTSGLLKFDADWKDHRDIMEYMERVTEGMGTISLQVSVITVSLDNQKSQGFDWSAMGAELRGGAVAEAATATVEGAAEAAVMTGIRTSVNSSAASFLLDHGSFSMTGLFSVLSKYGETRSSQNVMLKTLPGTEVSIRSGNSIPYVSGITSAATTGGAVTGGASFDTVESGVTIKITPNLDAKSGIVTMAVDMDIKSLLGFIDVSAGDQVGSASQPNIQEQSFNDISRVGLGDTVILGGVTFESQSDIRNSILGLTDMPVGHQSDNTKREALFIVIRPTAVMYKFDSSKSIMTNKDYVNNRTVFNGKDITEEVNAKKAADLAEKVALEAKLAKEEAGKVALEEKQAAKKAEKALKKEPSAKNEGQPAWKSWWQEDEEKEAVSTKEGFAVEELTIEGDL